MYLRARLVRFLLLRLRRHHELDGVVLHVRRDQHLRGRRRGLQNRVAVEHRLDLRLFRANGALDDAVQLFARLG